MAKKIVIVGTTDTEGKQLMMLREKIAAFGHQPLLMDLSMGGETPYAADITPEEIASLAGKRMQDIFDADDQSVITRWMTEGAIAKAQALLAGSSLDQCAKNVEPLLEEKGYSVFPFHAHGISDRAMDKLISQGFFDGVIEITLAGLIEEKFNGNRPPDSKGSVPPANGGSLRYGRHAV